MKKLFTLVALLAVFLGAKAQQWEEVYSIDYSTYSGFPFYVMGYVPEWFDGVMVDEGNGYKCIKVDDAEEPGDHIVKTNDGTQYYRVENASNDFHQYFIADGIDCVLDDSYKVVAQVKASQAVTINVNMGWGWSNGEQASASVSIPAASDFQTVEWEYSGIGGTRCNLVAQQQTTTQIEWKSLKVYHQKGNERPVTWQEWLTSDGKPVVVGEKVQDIATWRGNAETPWTAEQKETKFNDQEKNFLICAWSKEKGVNMNENDGWDPFPASIEEDPDDPTNHVFVCHGQPATSEGDASKWDNQFWIESPSSWKEGTTIKVHFRYRCNQESVKTATQIHKQNPSDYLHYEAIGDVTFTNQWQDFDKTISFNGSQNGGWSIAFNLNDVDKSAIDFYFDDLSWQTMKLDEGFFVASANSDKGIEYVFDTATEFVTDPNDPTAVVATVGTEGKEDTWVNEVMISTVRGNTAAFKGATIKLTTSVVDGDWLDYTEASLAKIKLPAAGVWQISIAPEEKQIQFVKIEGEEEKAPVDIITNPSVVTVNALERDWLSAGQDGNPREDEVGTGEAWDNQFWIVANRVLDAGEETVVEFDYVATKEAKATTQSHKGLGGYIHYVAIGDVNFTTEEKHFTYDFTIPAECAGKDMNSIAFNLAEIKDANDYTFKNFKWYLKNSEEGKTTENLINAEGGKNFGFKIVGGQAQYVEDPASAINNVVTNKTASNVTYNLAGQRVSKDFKGIVVKDGKKFMNK